MSGNDPGGQEFLSEFMDDYFAECDEHLTQVRRILLQIEPDAGHRPVAPDLIEELFRSFHSLKGLSGMVELRDAEALAHHLESYLRQLRVGGVLSVSGLNALVLGIDVLERVIAAKRLGKPSPAIDEVVERLAALIGTEPIQVGEGSGLVTPGAGQWLVRFTPSPQLASEGITVDWVRTRLREAGEITHAAPKIGVEGGIAFEFLVKGVLDPGDPLWSGHGVIIEAAAADALSVPPEPAGDGAAPRESVAPSHFVRVDLARLDELMRMIGDLVITRARLGESLARVERHVPAVEWRAVQENSLAIERHLRDLREGVMRVRLVPVGEIFRRMPFVVRDLAREMDKRVKLEIRGQDTEIDKFLIERMMDPILHLVRNAVVHGIEPVAERRATGKAEEGTLTLGAATVGEVVVVEIVDDGRGIDPAAIRRRAGEAGLSIPDGPLDSDALLTILCAAGFSTRDAADRGSGRGVGMAVVRTTVRELGGSMTLDSVPGQGTRFVVELPLTLAISDAIIANVGDQTFAVPQAAVREVIEVEPEMVRRLENNEIVQHRGGVLPLLRLSDAFALEARPRRLLHVLVAGAGHAATGIVVDRIIGQREIVVRAIADPLIKVAGISGATDLGDGRVVLILDLVSLLAASRRGDTRGHAVSAFGGSQRPAGSAE
ncbi:MAG TPA: chemotaxis protein CheA [Vicinamibacterales bacterium]|nr:chemotaxis protein CheA [Vicinamibacterales bacterium]